MRKTSRVLIVLLSLVLLAGCRAAPVELGQIFSEESVRGIRIFYRSLQSDAFCSLDGQTADFSALLERIYQAPVSKTESTAYSPELNASHRVVLAGVSELTLYYDETRKLISVPSLRVGKDKQPIRTYLQYAADISDLLDPLEATAAVPFEPTEEPPLSIDALLRAEIIQEELVKPGEAIDYEIFDYVHEKDAPLYSVLTYKEGIAGLENGYLLAVAGWGSRPSSGFEIDISLIEENESYYLVHVTHDSPVEGMAVENTATYPTAAALIDARRMDKNKIVVFLSEKDEILSLQRLDRTFFAELPADMPPLPDPEDMDGDIE